MTSDDRAARYHRRQLLLGALGLALGAAYLLAVAATGVASRVTSALAAWPWWAQVVLVAAGLGAVHRALVAPLAWVRGWWLPRRYGLLHQPLGGWFADQAKAAALSVPLALAGVEVIYALLRVAPEWWWLAAAAAFFVVYVALAVVLPVWIVPLFYRLTPLDNEALRARIVTLASHVGVPVVGVWVADQSRKSRTANAAVVGLGRTRRILLFDTLLGFAPREVEAVLAHELGHHVHRDVAWSLVIQAAMTLATFRLADIALHAGVSWWGLRGVADPAGLPWLVTVLLSVGLLTLPLVNGYSRWIERRADDFALRVTGDVDSFVGAMERLAALNLAERRPHRLKELLLYSHPSIDRRIARARRQRSGLDGAEGLSNDPVGRPPGRPVMKDSTRDAIALRRRLSARLRPLAIAIGVLISLGLPATYYVLELGALRRGAERSAVQLAARLPAGDATAIVREFANRTGAAAVRILDAREEVLPAVSIFTSSVDRRWNWILPVGTAPVFFRGETVGTVEVCLSQGPLVATTAGLLVLSTLTGMVLAFLVYAVPVRVVGGMESRLAGLLAEQASLVAAARVLASSLDLRDVLDHFTEAARSLPGVEVVRIWLCDPFTGAQTLASQSGHMRSDVTPTRALGARDGVSGAVIEARRPLVMEDVQRDPRLVNRAWYEAEGFVSYLGVPLLVGDVVVGALSCVTRVRRDWSPSDIALAETLGSLAAVAIRNATNFGEMTRRGDRLRSAADLARVVSGSLELSVVLRQVVAAVAALRTKIFCIVRLVDHAAGGYRVAGIGGAYEQAVFPVLRFGEGLTHLVAESGRPLLVLDARTDPRTMGLDAQVLQEYPIYYGVPIQSGETLLGVLSVSFPEGAPPTADEREGIELSAGQAAVAIQNARLFAESERQRRAAEALAGVGRGMSQALDPEIVATRIQDSVRELLGTRSSGLYRLDPASGALVAIGLSGDVGPTYGRPVVFPRGTGVASIAVHERRPVATPNVLTDPRVTLDAVSRERIEASGYRSVLSVPLLVKDTVVGALHVGDVEGRVFTDEEVQLLQTFADQAALALENARLYSEATRREREAEELARIARVLSESLDVTDVGARIVESVLPLFEGRSSGLYSLEPDGSLRGLAWGGDAHAHYTPGQRFPVGYGVIGWVAAHNSAVANSDVLADARFRFPEQPYSEYAARNRATLAVPLRAKAALIGVLSVADKPGRVFSDADVLLLQAFADQAALALENAQLYQRAQKAYAELAEAQDRLVRGETLRAMGELASGVAHHLNNLLAVILGRVQLALSKAAPPEIARHLQIAERATLDGAEVIRRMRGFGREEAAGDLSLIDLNHMAAEILELTRPRWEDEAHVHGITIETRLERGVVPAVRGEVGPLREVLMNLVLNAVDAMPEGGRITIRTWADDGCVHCSVSDTGVGMTPEVKRRALEPFFTTKGLQSTGLGLSVNYGIVQRLGGELAIDSVEGRGTTVAFKLPAADRPLPHSPSAAAAPPRALRVLVIDDEPEVRALLVEILAAEGHRVIEAAGGAEGLGRLDGDASIDVVLTDLGMPGMTGWDVARAVKARRPEVPVGLITGWGDDPVGRPEDRQAADFVLAKPLTPVSLRAALARAAAAG